MAVFDMRQWLASVRRSKLSTRLTVLFVAAIVLPWCAYAWLTISERSAHVDRTERTLAALAAAYGQHAATLMQLYAQSEVDDELTAFREALNVPDVSFSLGKPSSTPGGRRRDRCLCGCLLHGLQRYGVDAQGRSASRMVGRCLHASPRAVRSLSLCGRGGMVPCAPAALA